jgi:hypothetical protein
MLVPRYFGFGFLGSVSVNIERTELGTAMRRCAGMVGDGDEAMHAVPQVFSRVY